MCGNENAIKKLAESKECGKLGKTLDASCLIEKMVYKESN
jgi:hypothetical protein